MIPRLNIQVKATIKRAKYFKGQKRCPNQLKKEQKWTFFHKNKTQIHLQYNLFQSLAFLLKNKTLSNKTLFKTLTSNNLAYLSLYYNKTLSIKKIYSATVSVHQTARAHLGIAQVRESLGQVIMSFQNRKHQIVYSPKKEKGPPILLPSRMKKWRMMRIAMT